MAHQFSSRPFITAVLLLLMMSCSIQNGAPKHVDRDPAIYAVPVAAEELVIGEGDQISISVWRQDDLKRTLAVDPTGHIDFPLVGQLRVAGRTVPDLKRELTLKLTKYLVAPQVSVTIDNFASRKVIVLGEVTSPGAFILNQKMSPLEAIARAEGFTINANKQCVLLLRQDNMYMRGTALNLDIEKQETLANKESFESLKAGDILYVPPTKIANVSRFMTYVANIISPFTQFASTVILAPAVVDALQGTSGGSTVVVGQ